MSRKINQKEQKEQKRANKSKQEQKRAEKSKQMNQKEKNEPTRAQMGRHNQLFFVCFLN